MHPDPELLADLRHDVEVVHDAEVGRAARRHDGEERLGTVLLERAAQLRPGEASLVVTCTPQTSASITAAIDTTDEWALSVAAMRQGRTPVPASMARLRAVWRATTRAERFPTVPPGTKTPPACSGSPARSAIQRRAWFSA